MGKRRICKPEADTEVLKEIQPDQQKDLDTIVIEDSVGIKRIPPKKVYIVTVKKKIVAR